MTGNHDPSLQINGDSDTFAAGLCLDDDTLLGEYLSVDRADLPDPPNGQNSSLWFNHGLELLKKSAWMQAVESFDQCLESEPADDVIARSLALKGYAIAKHGRIEEAIACYESSLEIDGESIEALSGLSCAMVNMNSLDRALEYSLKACALRPENGPLRFNLGNVHLRMNDLDQAIAAYGAAISLLISLLPAWVNLAVAHEMRKDYEKSLEALDYAMVLRPDSRRVHVNRGVVLGRLRRWDEAVSALRTSLDVAPDYARSYILLSVVESCRGNELEAINLLNDCIDRGLMLSDAYYYLGRIHTRLGNHEQSIAAYMISIQIRPEHAKANQRMGCEYLAHEKLAEARAAFEKAVQSRPTLVSAWMGLADIASIEGDVEKRIECLEIGLSHEPLDPELNSRMVVCLVGSGDVLRARPYFEILQRQDETKAREIRSLVYPENG